MHHVWRVQIIAIAVIHRCVTIAYRASIYQVTLQLVFPAVASFALSHRELHTSLVGWTCTVVKATAINSMTQVVVRQCLRMCACQGASHRQVKLIIRATLTLFARQPSLPILFRANHSINWTCMLSCLYFYLFQLRLLWQLVMYQRL
jgi:hypothetical protein